MSRVARSWRMSRVAHSWANHVVVSRSKSISPLQIVTLVELLSSFAHELATVDLHAMMLLRDGGEDYKPEKWINMNQSEVVLRHGVIRVCINADGTFDILDFTLPSLGDRVRNNVPQEDVPKWMLDAVAMLSIADTDTVIDDLGYRLGERTFYVLDPECVEKKGETDDQEGQKDQ